eukprot:1998635-Rhodomonas_salina.1
MVHVSVLRDQPEGEALRRLAPVRHYVDLLAGSLGIYARHVLPDIDLACGAQITQQSQSSGYPASAMTAPVPLHRYLPPRKDRDVRY